jgi:hypothetical protein
LLLGPALWLDASDTATITESGGAVSQWDDKSGNGRNVTQGTGAAQPTTNLNSINGKNVLRFDGGDVMSGSMAIDVGTVTVFVVARETSNVNFAGFFVLAPSSGDDQSTDNSVVTSAFQLTTIFNAQRKNTNATIVSSVNITPFGVYVARFSSNGLCEVFSNTVIGGTATASSTFGNSTTALVGGRYQAGNISGSFRLNGDIAEIIVYPTTLTNNEMNVVGIYLSQKWGLNWANK